MNYSLQLKEHRLFVERVQRWFEAGLVLNLNKHIGFMPHVGFAGWKNINSLIIRYLINFY